MTDLVKIEIEDSVIIVRLNRQEKKNALTGVMYQGLADALEQLENDPGLHVALITGTKDCFTAGNDLVDFMESSGIAGDSPVSRFLRNIANARKPVIAAVNGPAVGVGTTMLLHCDLVYAAPGAKFIMPFVNLGLCPEAGSSFLLPQLIGHRRAAELLMFGDGVNAEQAKEMGLINEIVSVDTYQEYALNKARQLAQQPPQSVRVTKQLMRQGNEEILKSVMKAESEIFSAMLQGPEAKEAFSAFFEKRKPDFSKLG